MSIRAHIKALKRNAGIYRLTATRCGMWSLAISLITLGFLGAASAATIPLFLGFPHIDLNYWALSDGWVNGAHQSCEWRAAAAVPKDGKLILLLSDDGGKLRPLGCPEMHTKETTGYGVYEARMRSAAGSGLNTAFFTYVGPPTGTPEHDEIDFEFLGKDPSTVSITHYTNGKPTKGDVVQLGFDASKEFHNYSIEWTPHKIRWFVDGRLLHETAEADPIPRNPTRIYLSLWSGSEQENAWLGPFEYTGPVSAAVEWVKFTPHKAAMKKAGFAEGIDDYQPRQRLITVDFFLCSFSFIMLLIASTFGTFAAVGFLAPWVIIFVKKRNHAVQAIIRNWPLFLMPVLGGLSVIWSIDAMWTLKASAELAATLVVGIWAAELVKPRILISSLLVSLLIIAFICVVIGLRDGMTGLGDGQALQGIYSSKNAFSAIMSLLFLIALCSAADKKQSFLIRIVAVIAILVSPILLYLGHSVGAMIAVFLALMVYQFIRFVSRFGKTTRILIYVFSAFIIIAAIIPLGIAKSDPLAFLELLGKDTTLTGRTFLWQSAAQLISEKPLQGVGYRAFWRIGNPPAEELWFASHVPSGAGFNFHNEYIEMWVELGLTGVILTVFYFITLGRWAARVMLKKPDVRENFACLMFILAMLRTPVEVQLFDQFNVGIIIIAVCWVYLKPQNQLEATEQIISQANPYRIYSTKIESRV